MAKFTTRFDDVLVQALDALAEQHKISRNALLEHLAEKAIKQGFVPIKPGEGYQATADNGRSLTLIQDFDNIKWDNGLLSDSESQAFEQAKQLATRGLWYEARQILTQAGFSINNILK